MRSLASRAALLTAALLAALGPADPAPPRSVPASPSVERLVLSRELDVAVRDGRILELVVRVETDATYRALAERFASNPSAATAIERWNLGSGPGLPAEVRVPFALLSNEYRSLVLRNLFPEDRREGEDWIHVARSAALPLYVEGLWEVADWFTGRGDRFPEIMAVNGLTSPELVPGQEVRVPGSLLHPSMRAGSRSADGALEYGADERGEYAGYRLRPKEALYSAVVLRFTGRTEAADVIALADELARRSGIANVSDIPVGYLVKIPFDELDPEFLPRDHPRRREAEETRRETAEALVRSPVPKTRGLEGVVVVLDAGHGGRDLGTMNHGLWEHDYVYDVAVRLKALLESESAARVHMTIRDAQTGFEPSATDRLVANRQGTVLTDPPYLSREDGDAQIAVNLRWYLANSLYRKEVRGGTAADRVVFLSLHADARHPSLRGAMAYVPGAAYCAGTYGNSGRSYSGIRQVREHPVVKFSHAERVRAEAVSRRLADAVLGGFRAHGLPVQEIKPVRDKVVRGKQQFVPAVIRANQIPARVLVEMVNMSNSDDAALLATRSDRERVARALADGLFAHFGEDPR